MATAGRLNPNVVIKTLRLFVEHGTLSLYKDVRNTCYGVLVPYQDKETLVGNRVALERLLITVDSFHAEPKKLKRCFQALMGAYLELHGCDPGSPVHKQWLSLRSRIAKWLPLLSNIHPKPDWLAVAQEHRNLFGLDPTARYGADLLNGDRAVLDRVCETLGIGQMSWVRQRVVISAINSAAAEADLVFNARVEAIINLLLRNDGVKIEGAAILLDRYAQQSSTPENMVLRTFAIDTFGNPLITTNRQRWFGVSDKAREMVSGWLKGFLIERFFELLSHDGQTDKRRPSFWLKYRASIENMWFILGRSATSNWNEDFEKLRATMGNQCLLLERATSGNNAFVMKMGKVYVVEFGETGNATYLFDQNLVPFDLTQRALELSHLRGRNHLERLLHIDGKRKWESKFAEALSKCGVYPDDPTQIRRAQSSKTATTPSHKTVPNPSAGGVFTPINFLQIFKKFCNDRGLRYIDHGPSGGLVVHTGSNNSVISGTLGQWGFTYERDQSRWVKAKYV